MEQSMIQPPMSFRMARGAAVLAWAVSLGLALLLPPGAGALARAASEQTIIALVNDEPISAYDVEQRINLILLSSPQVGKRLKAVLKDPNTAKRFRAFALKRRPTSQEEVRKLQKVFVGQIRAGIVRRLRKSVRKRALEELIDERLKLQEAKKLAIAIDDAQIDRILTGLAKRNKMSLKQFSAMLKRTGVNIATMRQRLKANLAWQQIIRRRYGRQVFVGARQVERFISTSARAKGAKRTELHLHKITLPLPGKIDQTVMAARFDEADRLRRRFRSCKTTRELAKRVKGARFENLGKRIAESFPEPQRTLLLSATVGQMAPPSLTGKGIELYAICARRTVAGDEKMRQAARQRLQNQELAIFAKRHLKDLRQDAFIEYR